MGRRPCCSKEGMNRGAWTALEDKTLTDYINAHGEGKWRHLPTNAGLKRCGKSCRLRWLNYLRPDIKRGNISHDEEDLIIRLHQLLGNKWALIAGRLPGRTDNEIKNYWNTNLVKKAQVTHRHHHHHQNSPPGRDHSNHNHHLSNKNNPLIDPPSNNEPPMVHNMALIMSTNPVPENVDHGHVPMLRDISVDDLIDYGVSYNNTGMSPIPDGEDAVPENFMMDLTIGDLRLSDLLNSEFSDIRDFNYTKNGSIDDNDNNLSLTKMPPPTSDDHQAGILFSNEMLEDWGLCDQNVASHNSFSSFLDNEKGGWL